MAGWGLEHLFLGFSTLFQLSYLSRGLSSAFWFQPRSLQSPSDYFQVCIFHQETGSRQPQWKPPSSPEG